MASGGFDLFKLFLCGYVIIDATGQKAAIISNVVFYSASSWLWFCFFFFNSWAIQSLVLVSGLDSIFQTLVHQQLCNTG